MRTSLPLALAVLGLAGCGGFTGITVLPPNLFAGSWDGTWETPGTGESGAVSLTVKQDGGMGGSLTNDLLGATGELRGHMPVSGRYSASISYPGIPVRGVRGRASREAGRIEGTFIQVVDGVPHEGSWSLVRLPD